MQVRYGLKGRPPSGLGCVNITLERYFWFFVVQDLQEKSHIHEHWHWLALTGKFNFISTINSFRCNCNYNTLYNAAPMAAPKARRTPTILLPPNPLASITMMVPTMDRRTEHNCKKWKLQCHSRIIYIYTCISHTLISLPTCIPCSRLFHWIRKYLFINIT